MGYVALTKNNKTYVIFNCSNCCPIINMISLSYKLFPLICCILLLHIINTCLGVCKLPVVGSRSVTVRRLAMIWGKYLKGSDRGVQERFFSVTTTVISSVKGEPNGNMWKLQAKWIQKAHAFWKHSWWCLLLSLGHTFLRPVVVSPGGWVLPNNCSKHLGNVTSAPQNDGIAAFLCILSLNVRNCCLLHPS